MIGATEPRYSLSRCRWTVTSGAKRESAASATQNERRRVDLGVVPTTLVEKDIEISTQAYLLTSEIPTFQSTPLAESSRDVSCLHVSSQIVSVRDDWITLFSKYTSGAYTSSDSILRQPHATAIIGKLFESVGKEGLRYLIAWTFYRQLVQLTEPVELLRRKTPSEVCYEHVKRVMNLAIISRYFQSEVPPRMVYQTKRMVTRIRHTFVKAMESSSWISPNARHYAIELLYEITAHAGSPGRRLDPRFIADIYSITELKICHRFRTGQCVWVRPDQVKATVLSSAPRPRSYVVETEQDGVLQRNRRHLVPFAPPAPRVEPPPSEEQEPQRTLPPLEPQRTTTVQPPDSLGLPPCRQ
ncbi:hypothetical protein MRX96_049492 [Rhipicephalus microplus]